MHEENCRQEIRVADRNTVTINRVLNVSSFDEDGILVKTECGNIVVEGEELTIENLEKSSGMILINGKIARQFASQGQVRSIVLALKMAEGEIIKEYFSEYPVYLLDDVLSELDERRRAYILSKRGEGQIIITGCEYLECIGEVDNLIEVSGGRYVSSHR